MSNREIARARAIDALEPDIFGRYCLIERLGSGGMAEIFRARMIDSEDPDAYLVIKRILPNLADDEEFISMFVDEARIAVQLHHKNICQIYELGRLDDAYFMVMEHIAGQDLLAFQNHFRQTNTTMEPDQAAFVVSQMCRGLGYAHRKTDDDGGTLGIIHRDISPQNILISYTGEVKIIDFGIARARGRRQQTQVGVLKGKFGYMSPEQTQGQDIDHQSDIFAAGIMLWELLTNRRLFYSKNSNEILKKVEEDPIEAPSSIVAGIPPELDAICLKALRRDRRYRYQTADHFADDLDRFLKSSAGPYNAAALSRWICRAFGSELALEREKVRLFRRISTPDDVFEFYEQYGLPGSDSDPGVDDKGDLEAFRESATAQIGKEEVIAGDTSTELRRIRARSLPESSIESVTQKVAQTTSSTRVVLLVLVCAAIVWAGIMSYMAAIDGGPFAPRTGDLQLQVVPEGATIWLNGETVLADNGEFSASLRPGEYSLGAVAAGYEEWAEDVIVDAGESTVRAVLLEPLPARRYSFDLPFESTEGVRVFVDGEEVPVSNSEVTFLASQVGSFLVEIDVPGHFVVRRRMLAESPDSFVLRRRDFVEVTGMVVLRSTPHATAFIDGEPVGSTAESIEFGDLSPFDVHRIRLEPIAQGFQAVDYTLIFEGAYRRRVNLALPRIGRPLEEPVAVGFLEIDGPRDQWFSVEIDGEPVGLTTPFRGTMLPLTAGAHELALIRGDQRIVREFEVEEGRTVRVELPLPDEQPDANDSPTDDSDSNR